MSKVTLNLGWVLVGRWRVNLLSFVLVDGTIRSLCGWYIWRWYRHLRRTVQFSTRQTGWGKCSRIHKSTDTMMYPTFFQCLVDTMPIACLCRQGGMKTHSVRLTLRVTQTGRPHSQPDFTTWILELCTPCFSFHLNLWRDSNRKHDSII